MAVEQQEKEDKQAHLYTIIKVARDEDFVEQIGRDIYFDLVDHDKVGSFRIQKQTPFSLFKEEVAKEFGIPVQFQRFWVWARQKNLTCRPRRPLTALEEAQSVGQLSEVPDMTNNAELKLFLEVELGLDSYPIQPPEKSNEDILLFFKLYDPEKEELRYTGRLFVKSYGKPIEILAKLNQMAGFDPNEEIELYEEIKFEPHVMCELVDKKFTFRASQLEDGDIICFQKAPPPESEELYRYPDVPSFLEYVHNRRIVHFRSMEKPKEDEFCLELSKLHNYDDVVERVARQIGLDDPSKIRLTAHNCYSQQPKPQSIRYRGVDHLSDMLVHYDRISDILYYKVLDIPLPELQALKNLKVAFHHATKDEVVIHNIRLPKQSTVGDALNELKTKVKLSHPNVELRLLEVFYHKIYRIFPPSEKIENINDQYWTLRAEEIPEEEKNLGPHNRLIHVYHFTKKSAQNQMQVQNFGEPFLLVIDECETLAEVKVRIQKKLQVPGEEFSKWKFAFLSLDHPEYLQDSDIVSTRFQRRDVYGVWEQYLGLEHSDYAVNQRRDVYGAWEQYRGLEHFDFVVNQRRDVYGAWEQYRGLEHFDFVVNQRQYKEKNDVPTIVDKEDDTIIPPFPILLASAPMATSVVSSTQGLTGSTTQLALTPESMEKFICLSQPTDKPVTARTTSLPGKKDIGTVSLDDVDGFFQSLSPASSTSSTSQVSKPSKDEIEEALKQIKEALQIPPVQFDYPGRISPIEKALQTLSDLDESFGITIGQKADILSLTEKFKILPASANEAIKAKDNLAQMQTLKTTLDQKLKSSIAYFTVKKAETVQTEQEIQELKCKLKAAEKKKETLATEIKELYEGSLLDKRELDRLNGEMPKYEEEAKAGEEKEKAVNEEWKNMMGLISSISANLKFD